jgi:heptosyltransferase-2/heptosyltransferase-3
MRDEDLVLGLHVGGRGGKRWPADRFLALAERMLSGDGTRIILFWGPGEHEVVEQFRDRSLPGLFISPLLPVRDLAAQLEQCTAVICGDTGPMHLARAVGTPTVAIFLVPNYERYGHRGRHNRIVYSPGGEVAVDHVYGAVQDLLVQLKEEVVPS